MDVNKDFWNQMEKVQATNVGSSLICFMKCAADAKCGASLYNNSTRICEMANVRPHVKYIEFQRFQNHLDALFTRNQRWRRIN